MTNGIIHRGEIVEKIIRKSGYSLTKLAKKLGISRNTLYSRFENANLSYQFIMEVSRIIYHDFTIDFPEIKEDLRLTNNNLISQHEEDQPAAPWRIEGKYNQLLEKHNKLLEIIIRAINVNELHDLHQEIAQILKKEKEGKV
jgi:transcriptional regulator with XRE-family HTH domain